jgi:hypothetical protein
MTNALRPTIATAALATTIVALLIAGCGGGGSSSSKSTGGGGTNANPVAAASAKSPVVARADAICKVLNERRKAADKQVGAVTSVAALSRVAEVAPLLMVFEQNEVIALRKLTMPSQVAPAWQQLLAGASLLAEHAGKLGEAAKAKDLKTVEALIKEDLTIERELVPIATKAGFKHCGRNA